MTRQELRDYVDEQRALNNIPYHVYSTLIDGIDTLEQEPVLDKIRAEIEQDAFKDVNGSKYIFVNRVNQILDKYKAESEGNNG